MIALPMERPGVRLAMVGAAVLIAGAAVLIAGAAGVGCKGQAATDPPEHHVESRPQSSGDREGEAGESARQGAPAPGSGERASSSGESSAERVASPPEASGAAVSEQRSGGAATGIGPAHPCGDAPPEGMACVPGGWFSRGVADTHGCTQMDAPRSRQPSAGPPARVWVDTYLMDVTEVTNAAYEACVSAGACEEAGPLYRDFSRDEQPITGLSWYQAATFCRWRGGRLPTEAEWELAARGHDGEINPWGNEPATCELAVIRDASGRSCGVQKVGSSPDTGRVLLVKSRPPGRFGLYDMIGNAEEWVADWWTPSYAECGDACLGRNPRGPCEGAEDCPGHRYRSVRGGSWYWDASHATGWHRRRYMPSNRPPHHFGFRCARDLPADDASNDPR